MKFGSITKKLGMMSIIGMTLFGLTGCGTINCNAGVLNDYFQVGSASGQGILNTFNAVIDNNKGKITSFQTAYEPLGSSLTAIDFSGTISDMQSRQDTLASQPLVQDNQIAEGATDIIAAMSLVAPGEFQAEEYGNISLMENIARGVAYSVSSKISNDGMGGKVFKPTLISAYNKTTGTTTESADESGLGKVAVVYGYAVTSVHVEIHADSPDGAKVSESNEMLSHAGTSTSTLGERVKTEGTPTFETVLLSDTTEKSTSFNWIPNNFITSGTSAITTNTDTTLTYKNGTENAAAQAEAWKSYEQNLSNLTKSSDYAAYVAQYAKPFSMYKCNQIIASAIAGTKDGGKTTTYRVLIGTVNLAGVATDGHIEIHGSSEHVYRVYCYIDITDLEQMVGYTCLYKQLSTSSADSKPYSASSNGKTSAATLIQAVRNNTKNLPVYTLREDVGTSMNTFDADALVTALIGGTNSNGNSAQVNTNMFKDTGKTVNLISETAAGTALVSTDDLYLAGLKVGTISYESIPTEASLSIAGQSLSNNGVATDEIIPTLRVMQAPDYSESSPKFCVINGLYNIAVIKGLHVYEDVSHNRSYTYSCADGGMFLDILNGKIYSNNGTVKPVSFQSTGNMALYTVSDIRVTHRPTTFSYQIAGAQISQYDHYDLAQRVGQSDLIKSAFNSMNLHSINSTEDTTFVNTLTRACSGSSPFVLGTYLEAIYCPGIYPADVSAAQSEQFISVGRKLKLDQQWFDGLVTETTPAFTILNPSEDRAPVSGGKATGYVKYLYSVAPDTKQVSVDGTVQPIQGLVRFPITGQVDVVKTTAYQLGTEFNQANILRMNNLKLGEFKTYKIRSE